MRTHLALLGMVLCALPLLAEESVRRVAAPCEMTTASLTVSGNTSETMGREYMIRVTNNSPRAVALPRSPIFGWRVEMMQKGVWRLKAEGGPVRRVSAGDQHVRVVEYPESSELQQVAPAGFADFFTYLPGSEQALKTEAPMTTFKVTVYWAASAKLLHANRAVLPCALAPEWVVNVQKFGPGN